MYRLISDIEDAVDRGDFRTLRDLDFVRDERGDLLFGAGNNAIVFRAQYCGRQVGVRCYRLSKPYLSEIYGTSYLKGELQHPRGAVDVVVCDWVEGETLTRCVERRSIPIEKLCDSFVALSLKMLSCDDWAHGDLSGDNIIVQPDGELSLIDHDANYNLSLAGRLSSEMGTPTYQSPLRRASHFDSNIDDFPIALLFVTLRSLLLEPDLVDRYPHVDGLLLDGSNIMRPNYAPLLDLRETLLRGGDFVAYRLTNSLERGDLHIPDLSSLLEFSQRIGAVDNNQSTSSPNIELFERQGIWGYCDPESGVDLIPPLFDEAFEFHGDEALVRVESYWYYIDRSGAVVEHRGVHQFARDAARRL